ncbi:4'-phosphopantetheinyl transferase superfamily protein [Streptomyces sp. NPDC049577]|uniref:holo-ACP synthase n=1 Tax=Streptomyces sp. NPDC049577 TaxID=3155153 RepID=UPI00341834FD
MTATAVRVGVDVVPIARVRAMAGTDDGGPLHLMLTEAEAELCRFPTGWDLHGVAGRLAAKEAVFKLLRTDQPLPWTSIEILKEPGRWPYVRLAGQASRWAADAGIEAIDISISHEDQFAVAVASGAAARPTPKEEPHAGNDRVQP